MLYSCGTPHILKVLIDACGLLSLRHGRTEKIDTYRFYSMSKYLREAKNWFVGAIVSVSSFVPLMASAQNSGQGLNQQGLLNVLSDVVNFLIILGAGIAVLFIVVAGFQYMLAGGNSEKAGEARTRLLNGVIGLAIIVGAYLIANTVIQLLEGWLPGIGTGR